jgi:hypothetical protein
VTSVLVLKSARNMFGTCHNGGKKRQQKGVKVAMPILRRNLEAHGIAGRKDDITRDVTTATNKITE